VIFARLDTYDWWVMATGVVCAVACAVPGCYLVLRRMSMLGDAISHAILPGLAVAFLLTGTREVWAMLAGAMCVGLLTAVMTSALARTGRVSEDSAMGVVFTTLFALGVVLISIVARRVDLDANCVFYGLLEGAPSPANMRSVLGVEVPRSFLVLSCVLLLNATLVVVFWKELKIVAFDAALATSMGINAALVHYGLMAMIAGTTVASFESVGSILVVAMLVGPGAAAHLLTDRLRWMLPIAGVIAAACAVAGYLVALSLGTSVAGPMSVMVGIAFVLAALFSPRHGVIARAASRLALGVRIAAEDVLGMLYRAEERAAPVATDADASPGSLRRPLVARVALWRLRARGLVRVSTGALSLTDAGRAEATRVIRSHRLWEHYLTQELGLPADHVHDPSHRVEHFISRDVERDIASSLANDEDPHGRKIPGKGA
jgi:manganese/zinc/iron transport system permease protein